MAVPNEDESRISTFGGRTASDSMHPEPRSYAGVPEIIGQWNITLAIKTYLEAIKSGVPTSRRLRTHVFWKHVACVLLARLFHGSGLSRRDAWYRVKRNQAFLHGVP